MSNKDDFTINEQAFQEALEAAEMWEYGEEADNIVRKGGGTSTERLQILYRSKLRVFLKAYYESMFKL